MDAVFFFLWGFFGGLLRSYGFLAGRGERELVCIVILGAGAQKHRVLCAQNGDEGLENEKKKMELS